MPPANNNEYKLAQAIISLSNGNIWDQAKLEWKLESIHIAEDPDTCLCTHFPIIEICILRNEKNGRSAIVGNCCVKKFMGIRSDKLFNAVKRVKKDIEKSLNAETISYAHKHGWINDWDRNFYLDVWRKKNLSGKQLTQKIRINEKIVKNF